MPELQAAVRALSGVGAAVIAWPEPGGPATLRIELEPGADRERVTAAVLGTVEAIAGADLSSLEVALPPPPGAPPPDAPPPDAPPPSAPPPGAAPPGPVLEHAAGNGHASQRPAFEGVTVRRTALDVAVTVTLTHGTRRLTGEAQGLATRQAGPRVAAAATLSALRPLLAPDVRVQVDWVAVHGLEQAARPAVAQVAVAMLSSAGEQVMLGSALVRGDVRESAVRATLDALNRRLARLAVEVTGSP